MDPPRRSFENPGGVGGGGAGGVHADGGGLLHNRGDRGCNL